MRRFRNTATLWPLLLATSGMAQVTPVGSEFQVNSYTTGYQGIPKVCRAQAGHFAVVWRSEGQDGSASGIFGQRYDSGGNAVGAEFQVNTYTTGAQAFPALACAGSGDFVVVWRSMLQDGDAGGIFAQRYDSGGAELGTEFQVNTHTTGSQDNPGVGADAAGNFVVVWTSVGQDGDLGGVFGQRFASSGGPQGTEFQINTYTTGNQTTVLASPVAADADLNFVVTWSSDGQDGDLTGVFAQRFSSSGAALGTEFQVNSFTTSRQESPAVARDADGDFVIAWRSLNQDGSGYGIFGRRYSSAGAAAGTEFQINTYTTGSQSFPSVGINNLGDFIVAWASDGQDGDGSGVFAQRFDRNATALGTEFQVNTYTTGFQSLESVASDAMGNFVITWISGNNQDGDGFGVFGQRFEVPLCPPLPRGDCLAGPALRSFFLMKESFVSSRRNLSWKWLRGEATDLNDFGNPVLSTSYALCVYDEVAGVPGSTASFEVPPNSLCVGEPCWKAVGDRGYKYKNDPAGGDGVRIMRLKAGENGKAKIVLKGTGPDLALPPPASGTAFLNQDTAVTVQLVNSAGTCWSTSFPAPALKNSAGVFRDKEN
jgi:hypothetical protein